MSERRISEIGFSSSGTWPTPRANAGTGKCIHGDGGADLQTAVWSTPARQDAWNSCLPPSQSKRDTLPGDLIRIGMRGQLNPNWVETLMGLEPGWTKLPEGWKRKSGQPEKAQRNTTGSRPE
jgi:hypothetical protein